MSGFILTEWPEPEVQSLPETSIDGAGYTQSVAVAGKLIEQLAPTQQPDAKVEAPAADDSQFLTDLNNILAHRSQNIAKKIEPVSETLLEIRSAADQFTAALDRLKQVPWRDDPTVAVALQCSEPLTLSLIGLSSLANDFHQLQRRLSRNFIAIALVASNRHDLVGLLREFTLPRTIVDGDLGAEDWLHVFAVSVPADQSDLSAAVATTLVDGVDYVIAIVDPADLEGDSATTEPLITVQWALGPERFALGALIAVDAGVESKDPPLKDEEHYARTCSFIPAESIEVMFAMNINDLVRSSVDRLDDKVAILDDMYLDKHLLLLEHKFEETWKNMEELAATLTNTTSTAQIDEIDDDHFRIKYNEIAAGMDMTVAQLAELSEVRDQKLSAAIEELANRFVELSGTIVPDLKHIEGLASIYGTLGAYGYYEKRQRVLIWNSFRSLQSAGNETVQAAKNLMINALQEATGLKYSLGEGPYKFLTVLSEQFSRSSNPLVANEIKEYRDAALEPQYVDNALFQILPVMKVDKDGVDGTTAASIQAALTDNLTESARIIREEVAREGGLLSELLKLPNRLAYVRARRFRDALLFSPNSYSLWTMLLREHKHEIWQLDGSRLNELQESLQDMMNLFQTIV